MVSLSLSLSNTAWRTEIIPVFFVALHTQRTHHRVILTIVPGQSGKESSCGERIDTNRQRQHRNQEEAISRCHGWGRWREEEEEEEAGFGSCMSHRSLMLDDCARFSPGFFCILLPSFLLFRYIYILLLYLLSDEYIIIGYSSSSRLLILSSAWRSRILDCIWHSNPAIRAAW